MATIRKRGNSYQIRVYSGRDIAGRPIQTTRSWSPPAGMTKRETETELAKIVAEMETAAEHAQTSQFTAQTPFGEYAAYWVRVSRLAPSTRSGYMHYLAGINKAIGHIPIGKLRARHINEFYADLRQDGMNRRAHHANAKPAFFKVIEQEKISSAALSRAAGIAPNTAGLARKGKNVSTQTAEKIAAALGRPVDELFEFSYGGKLSDNTVLHYHRLIASVLSGAKLEGIISVNPAAERMKAPTARQAEAAYLDEEAAANFFAALLDEPDPRKQCALSILIDGGLRRGEVCGLGVDDLLFSSNGIRVRHSAVYVPGQGVIVGEPKTESSSRVVIVMPLTMEIARNYLRWREETGHFPDSPLLFTSRNGGPLNPDTINSWMEKFCRKNGFSAEYTPKALRHTFATLQVAGGVDIKTLQSRTGHSRPSTLTNTYSHLLRGKQGAAAGILESALTAKLPKNRPEEQ